MLTSNQKKMSLLLGGIWLVMGIVLMTCGIKFLTIALNYHENQILLSIMGALLMGFFKGKYILTKTAHRELERLGQLPPSTPLKKLISKRYYVLIAVMMSLGFLLRFVPLSVRGFIDIAVGCALIHGSKVYFRNLFKKKVPR